jgi:threonine aldolase
MAMLLYQKLCKIVPQIITVKPEVNALFVKLPKNIAELMQKERFFYTWDSDADLYRFMTSFDMDEGDIDEFVQFICKYKDRL